jgi:alpha-beta hydrolase superfamily lysophospholipase
MVFIYQGIQGQLFLPPLEFIRLSGAARRNIAMYRDFSRSYFHGHIHPDWPDIETAIANQQRVYDSCAQAEELYTVGTSTGGYCALLFGHYLKADIVYAFASQTAIDRKLLADNIPTGIPPEHRDLSLLLSEWNGRTRYRLYYCEDFGPDRDYAENVAHCPGVELVPLPGSQHNIFNEVDAEKFLTDLFPEPSTQLQEKKP